MKTATLEEFLGRLYADEVAQSRFLASPLHEARLAGLSAEDCEALSRMSLGEFELACRSFNKKRRAKSRSRKSGRIRAWLAKIHRAFDSRGENSRQKT